MRVSKHSAKQETVMNLTVGSHYFLPDLQLLSQPQNITVLQPVLPIN